MAKKPIEEYPNEYRFVIGKYPHDRFPMKRLAEYLSDLALMFGEEDHVHFIRLEEGSTVAVARIEPDYAPIVDNNLEAIEREEAPVERLEAARRVNHRLREDHTEGSLVFPGGAKILQFPGVNAEPEPEPMVYGLFSQYDTMQGVPISVGGKKELVHIHLQAKDGGVSICLAERSLAKRIAGHLFEAIVRVEGTAKWMRETTGEWICKSFRVSDFSVIEETSLEDDIAKLQAIPAKWKELEDPLKELDLIRHDGEIQ